jgi:hypothetical protein
MKKQNSIFAIIVFASLIFSVLVVLFGSSNYHSTEENQINTVSPKSTVSPEPKKAKVEVIVQPWYGVTDLANGYGIEVEPSNTTRLLFLDDDISIKINVMSEYWVIQYAYFFSDLVVDKVEIPVVNSDYAIGLKKSFIINFYNVPDGNHRVDFSVVLHDGTMGVASIDFVVDT